MRNRSDDGLSAFVGAPAVGSTEEFDRLVVEVERTAREWGIRSDSLESRFVSALLGCTRWMGVINDGAQVEFRRLFDENRAAAEAELARAREITRAANIALNQARNAQIALQVEQENVVNRMIEKTLPLFIQKMKEVLVLRQEQENEGVRRRRYAMAGLVVLGVFLCGYGLSVWQDSTATAAAYRCLAHTVAAGGHLYCDLRHFGR